MCRNNSRSPSDVWEWLGYNKKNNCKKVLEKHFKIDIDYTINFAAEIAAAKNNSKELRGGHNKEQIMLNINTFKILCLKADTEKADEIHKYYIKLEKIFNED